MKNTLFIISLFLFCSVVSCFAENYNEINLFVGKVLSKDRIPKLSEYYYFYGAGSEWEIEIEDKICAKKGLGPINNDENCLKYHRERFSKADTTPSFFLKWLRSKLPLSPKIKIISVEKFDNHGEFKYELIKTRLNSIDVQFYRVINDDLREQFGSIMISEINGKSIFEIFEKELENDEIDFLKDNKNSNKTTSVIPH